MRNVSDALYDVITAELPKLQQVTEEQGGEVLRPGGWTRKQEIGHLIDSATNNHVRFVRVAVEDEFRGPSYSQNEWVNAHGYNELPWTSLVHFWFRYNALIVQVLRRLPEERLKSMCYIGSNAPMTLGNLVEDYVAHMRHHLDQILKRENVTQYPRSVPQT